MTSRESCFSVDFFALTSRTQLEMSTTLFTSKYVKCVTPAADGTAFLAFNIQKHIHKRPLCRYGLWVLGDVCCVGREC